MQTVYKLDAMQGRAQNFFTRGLNLHFRTQIML